LRRRLGRLNARSLTAGLVSVAATAAFLAAAGTAQAVPSSPVGAAGIVPPGSARIGALPTSTTIQIEVALAPRDPAALNQFAAQVSTPGSPLYHDYIARGQFAPLFGPTRATINAVYAALRARGLRPGAISADHLSIPVTASAGQIESAFGVGMASYRLAGGGRGFANTNAPTLPANIASQVQGILGLDNLLKLHSFALRPGKTTRKLTTGKTVTPAVSTGGPRPCAAAKRVSTRFNALTANQLAFIYKFSDLYHAHDLGRGQTVGIVELGEPNKLRDITNFEHCYGIHTSVTYRKVDGFHRTGVGKGEAALDIETVASLAPRAHIIVYQAPNSLKDADDDYRVIVDQDLARVISISFGLCEFYERQIQFPALVNTATTMFLQGAVQGQTFIASSGDQGSEGCLNNDGNPSRLSVNFPASDPYVLSVGGTTVFHPLAQPPVEAVWNEQGTPLGASGGGRSKFFNQPQYQQAFGINSGVREVPDVSADADPATGYVILWTGKHGGWIPIGGTSAASPLWAALLTLSNARCSSSPVGWANPAIYFVASKANVLNDIGALSGNPNPNNNDYTGQGGGHYAVGAGYDMGTGLGTPIAGALARQLCRATAAPRGYWLVSATGHVSAEHAPNHGSFSRPGSRVVGIAAAHNNGYWLVTAKGRVKGFGIGNRGSVRHPSSPIVGIAPDKSGKGYWVVSSNGHVYAFGGARNRGGAVGAGRVVGIALDPQTGGYWIVTATGKVIAHHAHRFAREHLRHVTAIASDPKREGYWLVTGAGSVHQFGVPRFGGMFTKSVGRTIGIAGDPTFGGYFLATATGHVAAFNAVFHGDHAGHVTTGIAASH
jgi:subtilase family serine protease